MKKNDKVFVRIASKYAVELTVDNIYEYKGTDITLHNEDLYTDKTISSITRVKRSTFDKVLLGKQSESSNKFVKKCIEVGYKDRSLYKMLTRIKLFFNREKK